MTPQEELDKLIKQYKELTGRTIKMNSSSVKDSIEFVKEAIKGYSSALEEVADNFEASLSTLLEIERSFSNLDKALRGKILPEIRNLNKITLSVKNNNRDIFEGYVKQSKILSDLRKITQSRANIEAQMIAGKEILTEKQKEDLNNLLETTIATQNLAKEQLKIVQYGEKSSENISKFADLLSEIPIIGRAISKPFRELGDEILENSIKQGALNLQINAYGVELDIAKDKLKALQTEKEELLKEIRKDKRFDWVSDENIEGMKKIASGMRGITDKTKEFVEKLDEATKAEEKQKETIDGLNNSIKNLQDELKSLPSSFQIILNKLSQISLLGISIGILTTAFKQIKEAITEVDTQVTQLGRTLSLSYDQGVNLRKEMNEIASSSSLTTEELVKSQLTFTKLTGIASSLSKENLKTLAEASSLIEISESAQKGLISFAETSGKKYENIQNTVLGTSLISQIQNGLIFDQKEILEEVLSASASIRVQFENNVTELTKAVVEAKRLGFSLKDIEDIQSNLLNFESSITAELQAELLTGKELSLEKARYFSLIGDIKGLTQEINKEIGTAAEFENMNVLQREMYAKAVGLSAERLSEILLTQEQNDSIAKSLSGQQSIQNALKRANLDMTAEGLSAAISQKIIDKDALDLLGDREGKLIKSLSTQQEFNRTVEQLKEIFVEMMDGPVGGFLKGMNSLLKTINNSTIGKFAAGAVMAAGLLGSVSIMAAALSSLALRGTVALPMVTTSLTDALKAGPGMIGKAGIKNIGKGIAGAAVGMGAGSAIGGGGTSATVGSMIGTGVGALGYLAGPIAGAITMALGGMIGGAIGGQFDTPEPPPQEMASGGIVKKPTKAIIGEAGTEAVIPLNEFYAKIDKLISAVEQNRNVYMDGRLIGEAVSVRSFK